MINQGLKDKNFYELINFALKFKGYNSIADFLREVPNYWNDDQEYKNLFPLSATPNLQRVFTQRVGDVDVPIMATYLSDDAETPLITTKGAEAVYGEIPRMGNGYLFTAKDYEEAKQLELAGISAATSKVYDTFFLDAFKLINGIYSKRSFTALQVESQGFYRSTKANNNGGIEDLVINMNPVATNKLKAGFGDNGAKYAWSSPDANPIGDLIDMFERGWRRKLISPNPANSVFRMNLSTYNILKNHASTKKQVALWKTGYLGDGALLSNVPIVDEDLNNFIKANGLPEISVSLTYGFTNKVDVTSGKVVEDEICAFADNVVVLRRKGTLGTMQWSQVSNIFQTSASPVYYADGGSIAVQEDIYPVQRGIKFSAESLCVPVPNAIETIQYLDISQASE